tara:strand:- start:509 stop:832 length:324 start_codon:yes stop_codon:yes gene_type:complete
MKTDRELVEFAAKAAGIEVRWTQADVFRGSFMRRVVPKPEAPCSEWLFWRPLHDDGDALWLAVSIAGLDLQWIIAKAWQAHDDEPARRAYVRRAIVLAAAAVGESMP